MCYSTTPRERITPKDIQQLMGWGQKKAYQYYNQIRQTKAQTDYVFVDDVAAVTGISRDAIKSSLAR
ncbi:hypothetical protein GCM10027578_21980 [Spirosoma luteolum]